MVPATPSHGHTRVNLHSTPNRNNNTAPGHGYQGTPTRTVNLLMPVNPMRSVAPVVLWVATTRWNPRGNTVRSSLDKVYSPDNHKNQTTSHSPTFVQKLLGGVLGDRTRHTQTHSPSSLTPPALDL
jgi:hypothetical protein